MVKEGKRKEIQNTNRKYYKNVAKRFIKERANRSNNRRREDQSPQGGNFFSKRKTEKGAKIPIEKMGM